MKKVFIGFLFFFWGFHFVLPMLYYTVFGFFNAYSTVNDVTSLNKAFAINTLSIALAVTIISLIRIPNKKVRIEPVFKNINFLFYITCAYVLIFYFSNGGHAGILSGKLSGTLLSYINKFIDVGVIFALLLFYQKKKYNFYYVMTVFFVMATLIGSRSAVITILIISFFYLPLFKNFYFSKNKIKKSILFLSIISPLLFYIATSLRGVDVDPSILQRLIIGRISMLELSMIPIDCKDNLGEMCNLDVFYDKYNIGRQFLQAIDSMYPGDIWVTDVHPNQYYRSAFLGQSEDYSRENYQSINMTLPTFFYMYTNEVLASVLSACLIVTYYLLMVRYFNNIYLFAPLLLSFYTFIYGFDFVMTFNQIYVGVLTTSFVYVYALFYQEANNIIRN